MNSLIEERIRRRAVIGVVLIWVFIILLSILVIFLGLIYGLDPNSKQTSIENLFSSSFTFSSSTTTSSSISTTSSSSISTSSSISSSIATSSSLPTYTVIYNSPSDAFLINPQTSSFTIEINGSSVTLNFQGFSTLIGNNDQVNVFSSPTGTIPAEYAPTSDIEVGVPDLILEGNPATSNVGYYLITTSGEVSIGILSSESWPIGSGYVIGYNPFSVTYNI
jgi:cytoskeletal protein RodZ